MSTARALHINETFLSLQGESTQAGRVSAFVRLMGCPLRCNYCDTAYAFHEGNKKSFDELFETLDGYKTKLVEVTGGEPLAQPNVIPFMRELVERGFEVMIETSGAFSVAEIPPEVRVILDVKTPGSGEAARMHWDNIKLLKPGVDEVKFVVCSKSDFDFACRTALDHDLFAKQAVLVSPEHGKVAPKDLAEWVLASQLPFRLQLQMHKYIWGAETRGV